MLKYALFTSLTLYFQCVTVRVRFKLVEVFRFVYTVHVGLVSQSFQSFKTQAYKANKPLMTIYDASDLKKYKGLRDNYYPAQLLLFIITAVHHQAQPVLQRFSNDFWDLFSCPRGPLFRSGIGCSHQRCVTAVGLLYDGSERVQGRDGPMRRQS